MKVKKHREFHDKVNINMPIVVNKKQL